MKRMDKDGDGKLSMEEILADPESEPDQEEKDANCQWKKSSRIPSLSPTR